MSTVVNFMGVNLAPLIRLIPQPPSIFYASEFMRRKKLYPTVFHSERWPGGPGTNMDPAHCCIKGYHRNISMIEESVFGSFLR
jgi:hypothetical protein